MLRCDDPMTTDERLAWLDPAPALDAACAACRNTVANEVFVRVRGLGTGASYDHIEAYTSGGPTRLDNLQRLCGPHNRAKGTGDPHPEQ